MKSALVTLLAAASFSLAHAPPVEFPVYLDRCIRSEATVTLDASTYAATVYGCEPIGEPNHLYVEESVDGLLARIYAFREDGTGVWGDSEGDMFESWDAYGYVAMDPQDKYVLLRGMNGILISTPDYLIKEVGDMYSFFVYESVRADRW